MITNQATELANAVLNDTTARKVRWAIAVVLVLGGAGVTLALTIPRGQVEVSGTGPLVGSVKDIDMPAAPPFRRVVFSRDDRLLALGDSAGGITVFQIDWGNEQLRLRQLPLQPQLLHTTA